MSQQQTGAGNYKGFLQTIGIIHLAIIAGFTMATVFIANILSGEFAPLSFTQQPKEFIIPIGLIGAIALGRFLGTSMLSKLKVEDRLQKKLATYQTTHIIKIAMLEIIGFASLFSYSSSNNSFFIVIVALVLIMLFSIFPTKEKIENAIPTSTEDQPYLRNPEKPFHS
ncbi:hypothetical protein [uncultured Dokdonia sp.]|uniref:hypothetical protein n=1 Tax=uncultured Dokdonia sp. TaxID=575653 RepID=UPI002611E927|nr:hypothetical protein [uncultured Dokdonia sp.]